MKTKKSQSECDKITRAEEPVGKVLIVSVSISDERRSREQFKDENKIDRVTAAGVAVDEEESTSGDLFAQRRGVNYTRHCVKRWDPIRAFESVCGHGALLFGNAGDKQKLLVAISRCDVDAAGAVTRANRTTPRRLEKEEKSIRRSTQRDFP
jgi:hypothetical protein